MQMMQHSTFTGSRMRHTAPQQQQQRSLLHASSVGSSSSSSSSSSRARCVAVSAAKKGGGGKKGAQKKGGSALADLLKKKEAASNAPAPAAPSELDALARPEQYADPDVVLQLMMITQAYKKQYNEYLIETGFDQLAEAMFKAPFVCLAHNIFEEGVEDPLFTYANKAALETFEATWDTLIGSPSRNSAEPENQEGRNQILQQAASDGAVKDYGGWRVSAKGKRFRIKDVRLFNVTELDGTPWGQAAVFSQYELEDGTVVTVQGEQPGPSSIEVPPSQEDVAAAEAAVQEQAAAVRALKEGEGLGNADPKVQQAVAELQQRKAAQTALQEKYQAVLREAEAEAAAPATVESSAEE